MKTVIILMTFMANSVSCQLKAIKNNESEVMNEKSILEEVRNNNIQAVTKSLEAGANPNTADENKRSLLLIATINKHDEMIKLLVTYGADVNQQADNLDSPFLYAGATGQTESLRLFLDNGARFDVFNRYYGSALIPACERGHVETVKLLAHTKDYPIDHVNRLGWTGLMEAVVLGDGSKKYQEIVQILKGAGAKMDIPDHEGVTPLEHAKRRGFREIAAILQ